MLLPRRAECVCIVFCRSKSAPIKPKSVITEAQHGLPARGSVAVSYGSGEVAVQPRGNTAAEDLVAVVTMALLFGCACVSPFRRPRLVNLT